MSTFRDAVAGKAEEELWAPPKVITVQPDAFESCWPGRPSEPVEMGLRLVPDDDLQTARAEAAKYASRMHEDPYSDEANACFNDALLRWIVARSTCQADDVRRPWFEMAEDTVRLALTDEGVKAISFELEVFRTERSPLQKPASDEDLLDLSALLQDGAPWELMSEAEQRGTRRLAAVILERFSEALARAAAAQGE